mmetsp:Transcript_42681/g.101728  ORF Transcript_42681/g.101728 Transcript_42681/m.101728 type:complete len:388 (+) Transcript_42681:230-1393(+)
MSAALWQHVLDAQLLEDGLVLQCCIAPGELCSSGHRSLLHLNYLTRLRLEELTSSAQDLGQGRHRLLLHNRLDGHLTIRPEPVQAILDSVLQTSGWGDDGQRSHAHGLHLHQAAGLPPGRQQREVAASEESIALRAHPACVEELAGILLLDGLGLGHEIGTTRTDDNDLELGVLEDLHQGLQEQVIALLGIQPSDEAHQGALALRHVVLLAIEVLQLSLGCICCRCCERPTRHHGLGDEVHVTWGHTLFDTVQDSCAVAHLEEGLQLHALLGIHSDLFRVGRGHGQGAIRVAEASSHGVDARHLLVVLADAERHLEGDAVNVPLGHAENLSQAFFADEAALKDRVVAQEGGLGVLPAAGGGLRSMNEHGHEGAVPVVAQHHAVAAIR